MIKKFAVVFLTLVVTASIAGYGAFQIFYHRPGKAPPQDIKNPEKEDKFVAAGRTNVAILGVDRRNEDEGRADAVIVAMYDPKAEKINLISVPRDMRVYINGGLWDKINHAYNYGGTENVVATLEKFLGISIKYYVQVDFSGFERIVDAIGGVPLTVRERMYYEDPWDGPSGFIIDLKPGEQVLDGKKAMQFVRYRDEEGDVGRVKRQQDFLAAFYAKMADPAMWTSLPDLTMIALSSVSTNMGFADMLQIGRTLRENSKSGLRVFTAPGEPVHIDGISYLLPDIMAIRSEITEMTGMGEGGAFMNSARRLAMLYRDSLPENVVYYGDDLPEAGDAEEKTADKAVKEKVDDKRPPADKENPGSSLPPAKKEIGPDGRENKKPAAGSARPPASLPAAGKPGAPPAERLPRQLRAAVVNCSGDPSGALKMQSLLQGNGVTVTEISDGNVQNSSSIISNTYDGWVLSKLAGLPFRYSLKLSRDNNASVEAIVYVGKDFI
ncbi:MAG: LCP family protein [Acidaminococcales bacterium]|nr:LCP family protein [Acidaminococcales bacterium]